jgi:hypothetical protein
MARLIGLFMGIWLIGAASLEAQPIRFPDIAGWKASGDVQVYVPETLYEYIDGAADLYLACHFEELKVAEYGREGKASVTVEVYRHRTTEDAFGIYSQERLPGAAPVAIGAQGYGDENALNFLTGHYYVKIAGYGIGEDGREILQSFARAVAWALGEGGTLPPLLAAFPAAGKVTDSERYISRNFLGYSFLSGAFTADYGFAGGSFKLFFIRTADRSAAGEILVRYLRQVGQAGQQVREGRHTLSDPHHGVVEVCWQGRHIWGTLDLGDAGLRSRYLDLLGEGLNGVR